MLRRFLIALTVSAAWVGWQIFARQPLRKIHVDWPPGLHTFGWTVDPPNPPYVKTGQGPEGEFRLEIDLASGRYSMTKVESASSESQNAANLDDAKLSWIASFGDDGVIHVKDRGDGRERFEIPQVRGFDSQRGYWLSYLCDGRLLRVNVHGLLSTEIWDVTTGNRRISAWCDASTIPPYEMNQASWNWLTIQEGRMAAFVDSGHVGVWDLATGELLTTLDAPGLEPGAVRFDAQNRLWIHQLEARIDPPSSSITNGAVSRTPGIPTAIPTNMVVKKITRDYVHFEGRNPRVKYRHSRWSVDLQRKELEFERDSEPAVPTICPNGSYANFGERAARGHVWDLSASPPRCADLDLGMTNSEECKVQFGKAADVWLVECPTALRLYDGTSLRPRALENPAAGCEPSFSPSGHWIIAECRDIEEGPTMLQSILRVIRPRALRHPSGHENVVWNVATGKLTNRFPGDHAYVWPEDDAQVWTVTNSGVGPDHAEIFELWPLVAPAPPWWLWLLTGAGVCLVIRRAGPKKATGTATIVRGH